MAFYTQKLGFALDFHPAPGFAIVSRNGLRLALNATGGPGGATQPMPDGRTPEPGGWNRLILEVEDLEKRVEGLRAAGVTFRGVARIYETSFIDGVWKWWRDTADFSPLDFAQRFVGTYGDGGKTIDGRSEISHDGTTWENDLQITYRRSEA